MDDRLLTAPPIWLVVLDVLGALHFIASEQLTVTDARGFVRRFRAGLTDATISTALGTMGESAPGEPQATFLGLHIPDALDALSSGAGLVGGSGELSVIAPGEAWERRTVLCVGRVQESRVRRGDLVDVTFGDRLGDDRGTLLPPSAVVNSDTWPAHADNAADQGYPVVFGEPGVYTLATGATGNTTGSPAPMVVATGGGEKVLISLGRVEAQNVTIRNEDDGTAESFAVTITEDALGQIVSIADISAAATLTVDDEATYHARWDGGGGILDSDGRLLETAGALLIWALRRSTLRVDFAALEAVRPELDRYIVGGYVNDTGFSPIEWIADNLMPILPISLTFGPLGLGAVIHDIDYARSAIELVLDEDSSGGLVRFTDDGISTFGQPIGTFRLLYAWSVLLERARRKRTVTGDAEQIALGAANISADVMCLRATHALERAGANAAAAVEEIETRVVYDEATARLILSRLAAHRAVPSQEVRADVAWPIAARLRLGQVVQVKSRELRFDRPGRVAELGYSRDGVNVRVVLDAHAERERYNLT